MGKSTPTSRKIQIFKKTVKTYLSSSCFKKQTYHSSTFKNTSPLFFPPFTALINLFTTSKLVQKPFVKHLRQIVNTLAKPNLITF